MRPMRFLKTIDRMVARLEWLCIALFILILVWFTFLQVVLRALSIQAGSLWAHEVLVALNWSDPLVRVLVLWLTFVGASLLTREGHHIRIDLLFSLSHPVCLALRDCLIHLVSAFLCGLMVWVCLNYLQMEREFGGTWFLGIPAWVAQVILPVGFGLLGFRFSIRMMEAVSRL